MPDSGYYAARQRRVLAVTRQWAKVLDATTMLVSVVRWSDSEEPVPHHYEAKQRSDVHTHLFATGFGYRPTLTSNVVTVRA